VCGACLWEEERKKIDWDARIKLLKMIANTAKEKANVRGTYDCAVGVSGGKDSTLQAIYAKEELGLNCLLVSAVPDQINPIGEHNINNLINHGFDCVRIYVNPKLLAQLMKRDFFKYLHFRKATEYPMWSSTYRMAKEKNIPLIIQGENAALTLGVSDGMNTDWDCTQIYKTNTIGGIKVEDHYSEIDPKYLIPYKFPDMKDWEGTGVWLQWFLKDWSQYNNAQFSMKRGFKPRDDSSENLGRLHPWSCCDSDMHPVSQYHKFVKYGFGFATDEVCYDIRDGRITRQQGFDYVDLYDGKISDYYIDNFCKYVDITRKEHDDTVDKFANKDLLVKEGKWWVLKPEIKKNR
jgi:N-acetyl sugar amidotransferase